MRLPEILTRWLPGRGEQAADVVPACVPAMMQEDHFDLEDIACGFYATYTQFVADGRDRYDLAKVITGLAGIATAQSCTAAFAWAGDETVGSDAWSQSDTDGLSGLLLLEVARCAEDGRCYGLVEPRIGELDDVKAELLAVALAYADEDRALIGQRLYELGFAVSDTTGSAAGEALVPLARAHGFCHDCSECAAGSEVAS